MLVIQIPIIFFIGGLLAFFASLFALLKIVGWYYQAKMFNVSSAQFHDQALKGGEPDAIED